MLLLGLVVLGTQSQLKHFCNAAGCGMLQLLSRDKVMLEAKLLEVAADDFNTRSSFPHTTLTDRGLKH